MNSTCTIDGCIKPLRSPGATMCPMHYHRWYRHGDPHKTADRSGITASKGRRYKNIYRPNHILATKYGRLYEHRMVLFDKIGYGPHRCQWCSKVLYWGSRGSNVIQADHVDGDGANNHPDNLVPACPACNVTRANGKRHLKLKEHGFFSKNDTVFVTDGRKYDPATMELPGQ